MNYIIPLHEPKHTFFNTLLQIKLLTVGLFKKHLSIFRITFGDPFRETLNIHFLTRSYKSKRLTTVYKKCMWGEQDSNLRR